MLQTLGVYITENEEKKRVEARISLSTRPPSEIDNEVEAISFGMEYAVDLDDHAGDAKGVH